MPKLRKENGKASERRVLGEPSTLVERLVRFSRSLGLALFDRRLELDGCNLVFYYDTNVVYHMILGFETDPVGQGKTVRQRLVRSLLGCHRLGVVNMLRPHALELEKKLDLLPKPTRKEEESALRARVRQHLQTNSITQVLSELHDVAVDGSVASEGERSERFLSILRQLEGAEAFIAIEQVSGIWSSRLRRYYDTNLLRFEELGPNVGELMRDHRGLVLDILPVIEEAKDGNRTASLHDSMALAVLRLMTRDSAENRTRRRVRFYTHDDILGGLLQRDDRLRAYRDEPAVGLSSVGGEGFASVLRDDDYFLMRLRFEELGFGRGATSLTSLEEVERLYLEIRDSLGENEGLDISEETLQHIRWRGQPLLEVLSEFEDLALMDSIWARHDLPKELVENLNQWTEVFEFARSGEFREALDQKVADIQEDLSSKVSQMRRWVDDFRSLLRDSRSWRRRIHREIESPMRDLGLVRWGYSLSAEAQQRLIESVKSLLQAGQEHPDQEELNETCSQLAGHWEEARRDLDECLFVAAILWTVGKYDALVELVHECQGAVGGKLPPTLVVLQAAAELKALDDDPKSNEEGFAQRKILVDRVLELWGSLSGPTRGGYLLGVGYVLYHAWKSESGAIDVGDASSAVAIEVQEWATRSLEAGREARRLLSGGSLAWAFAVNHCAYVGLVTGAATEEESEVERRALVKLQGEPVWNSRFADTLGCYYLYSMDREWELSSVGGRQGLDFERRISRAEAYFSEALELDFGDIDLAKHIQMLEDLKDRYGAVRKG